MPKKIKILLADDHAMFRDGLKQVINSTPGFNVIAEAGNGNEAIKQVDKYNPDLVLMDINMPQKNGIETSKEIKEKWPQVKIIILTMLENELYILDALKNNVEAFIYKDAKITELLKAMKEVVKGKKYLAPNIKEKVMDYITSKKFGEQENVSDEKVVLTPRQLEIIRHVADGLTSKQVAEKLFLSEFTVIKHRKNIIKKLGVKNFTEVVSYAYKEKIL